MRRLKIFFDGGCRPNPGPIEVAVVAQGRVHIRDDLGRGDNHDAEWLALIEAVQVAIAIGEPGYDLIGDSITVIGQATGKQSCRSAKFAAYRARFLALAAPLPPRRIRWIGRAQNLAGIALAARHRM